MKKVMNFFCRITLMILAFVTSASSGVMMADASNLPDAGKMTAGADGTGGTDGIATETAGRENGDPNFYLSDVDKRIVKIRPMATPIDQISRYAKSSSTNSFEVKYYSVGTREIKCSTNKKLEAMTGGAGAFFLKPDSALGRLFLWKITCQAITKYPWGCDKGFAFAYGEAQENYFARGHYAEWEERVAGSPEYAFNEYLELILTQGPVICIMLMVITLACLWAGTQFRRYGVCGAIIALLIFSFSSYPMHLPAFIVAYVCLLLACGIGDIIAKPVVLSACLIIWIGGFHGKWQREKDACRDWVNARMLYHAGAYAAANAAYDKLYPQLREKGTFLFEYGHSLHKAGFYNESNKYLDKALVYCADPMILNVIGKNYQALRCYHWAEELLLASVHRLPGRIYPYYLLAKLYAEPEFLNREKFEEMKRIVLMKAPKIHSTAIEEMRREVEEIAKELEK